MAIFFIFITNLLNLYRSTLLMYFERKTSQNQFFYRFYLGHEQKLEKNLSEVFKLESISILAIRNHTPLSIDFQRYTCVSDLALQSDTSILLQRAQKFSLLPFF